MRKLCKNAACLLAVIFFVVMGCILLFQVFLWLYVGDWEGIPAIFVLVWIFPNNFLDWFNYAENWVGVKKVIQFLLELPLTLWLLVLGFGFLSIGEWFDLPSPNEKRF